MMKYYSPSKLGFFDSGDDMPDDAREVSIERFNELMEAPSMGMEIVPGPDGMPIAVPPGPPSSADLLSSAINQRDNLLRSAALRMSPLQYAVELNVESDDERVRLLAFKHYCIDLSRIEQQKGFPESIDWPVAPE